MEGLLAGFDRFIRLRPLPHGRMRFPPRPTWFPEAPSIFPNRRSWLPHGRAVTPATPAIRPGRFFTRHCWISQIVGGTGRVG